MDGQSLIYILYVKSEGLMCCGPPSFVYMYTYVLCMSVCRQLLGCAAPAGRVALAAGPPTGSAP
jgi:hypothetical protein